MKVYAITDSWDVQDLRSAAAVLNMLLVASSWHPRLSPGRPDFNRPERNRGSQPTWRKSLNKSLPTAEARRRRKRHRQARRRGRRTRAA